MNSNGHQRSSTFLKKEFLPHNLKESMNITAHTAFFISEILIANRFAFRSMVTGRQV